jgi:signal transduction histidine kinase
MNPANIQPGQRILVIDDNRAIHEDFCKILGASQTGHEVLEEREALLFGESAPPTRRQVFHIDSAFQGEDGLRMLQQAVESGEPYALAFVDVRMGPGLDGIETTAKLWDIYPDLQVVICTAHSDYSWDDMVEKLGHSDRLVILKKPFDNVEVQQLANALTQKWRLLQQAKVRLDDLEKSVCVRTEELQATNQQLQAEIGERMQVESALRQSQEAIMQQERLAAVGQLSAGVAHDFNNILCIILGYASMLLDNSEDMAPKKVEALKQISTAAQRAAHLTRQLLTFSRKQVMQPQTLEFNEVVGNVSRMLQRLVGEDIGVQFHFSPKPVHIHADLGMMEQIVMNLVVNARDAMVGGGKLILSASSVEIDEGNPKLHPDARPGQFACLSVSDTGCGIPPEHLLRIFEPFFTTKAVGKGTGLGLATVYGIDQQGGRGHDLQSVLAEKFQTRWHDYGNDVPYSETLGRRENSAGRGRGRVARSGQQGVAKGRLRNCRSFVRCRGAGDLGTTRRWLRPVVNRYGHARRSDRTGVGRETVGRQTGFESYFHQWLQHGYGGKEFCVGGRSQFPAQTLSSEILDSNRAGLPRRRKAKRGTGARIRQVPDQKRNSNNKNLSVLPGSWWFIRNHR